MVLELGYKPTPPQSEVHLSKARFKVVVAGRRTGKTTLAINELIVSAVEKPGSLLWYISPTYRQSKQIAFEMLKTALPQAIVKKTNESELSFHLVNGSRIELKGADNEDGLRGVGLNGVVMDEFASMKDGVWEQVILPALTDKKGWAIFIGTPKGFNAFYRLYEAARTSEGWSTWHFTSYDNPYLDSKDLDHLKAEMDENEYAQEIMADFRKRTGLVWDFPESQIFDPNVTALIPVMRYPDKVIGGVDWGWHNPAAILSIKVKDAAFYVNEEWEESQKTTAEIVEKGLDMKRRHGVSVFYPDPAETDRIEEMKRAGLTCGETTKDIAAGCSHVASLIKAKRLFISQNCKKLLAEINQYHYEEDEEGKPGKEKPVKDNDHLCDALRYALMGYRPVTPERIAAMIKAKKSQPKGAYAYQ